MKLVRDENGVGAGLGIERQSGRLRDGGAFIEQGSVGDVETGEVADQGLEVQQGFQAALGDLGLVGRVGGVPAGVFKEISE